MKHPSHIKNQRNRIEVEIDVNKYPTEYSAWERWIVEKLKSAGIPIIETLGIYGVKYGTLHRLDDPSNFGKTKYVWISDGKTS